MKELSNPLLYGKIILIITSLFAIFHILTIAGIIPDKIVWGGKLSGSNKFKIMEIVSLLFIIIAGISGYFTAQSISNGNASILLKILAWFFTVIFTLNTVGNIFAETNFERYAFTPVTIVLAYLFLRLAIKA